MSVVAHRSGEARNNEKGDIKVNNMLMGMGYFRAKPKASKSNSRPCAVAKCGDSDRGWSRMCHRLQECLFS